MCSSSVLLQLMLVLLLFMPTETATSRTHFKMEAMKHRSSFRKKKSTIIKDNNHELIFAIKQNNLDVLDEILMERSNPSDPKYQQWLTYAEVTNLTANVNGTTAVQQWLEANDIKIHWKSKRGHYIKARASVATWETQLDTTFYLWQDTASESALNNSQVEYIRAVDYSVPVELLPYVASVFNTVQVPPVVVNNYRTRDGAGFKPSRFQTDVRSSELLDLLSGESRPAGKGSPSGPASRSQFHTLSGSHVTPAFLRSLYGVPSTAVGLPSLSQSVLEMSDAYYSPEDLRLFQQNNGLAQVAAVDIGGRNTSDCGAHNCLEGNLDLQFISGVAQVCF